MSEPVGEWRIPPGATPVREGPDGLWVVCPEEEAEGYTWLPAERHEGSTGFNLRADDEPLCRAGCGKAPPNGWDFCDEFYCYDSPGWGGWEWYQAGGESEGHVGALEPACDPGEQRRLPVGKWWAKFVGVDGEFSSEAIEGEDLEAALRSMNLEGRESVAVEVFRTEDLREECFAAYAVIGEGFRFAEGEVPRGTQFVFDGPLWWASVRQRNWADGGRG